MRVLIQRVNKANVVVDNKEVSNIGAGYVIFVGFTNTDTNKIVDEMVNKLLNLRIMDDEQGKMNLSVIDKKQEILSISQFTLYADCHKGNRPSFTQASGYETAKELYDYFNQQLLKSQLIVKEGIFGADMKVNLINDGPVTIMLDSDIIFK